MEASVVSDLRSLLALQKRPDLQLQVTVGCLQAANLLQVGGQTIVQALHGDLLVGGDVNGVSHGEAGRRSRGDEGGPGHTDSGASGTSVHAAHSSSAVGGAVHGG